MTSICFKWANLCILAKMHSFLQGLITIFPKAINATSSYKLMFSRPIRILPTNYPSHLPSHPSCQISAINFCHKFRTRFWTTIKTILNDFSRKNTIKKALFQFNLCYKNQSLFNLCYFFHTYFYHLSQETESPI